jgi:hypothetical protein
MLTTSGNWSLDIRKVEGQMAEECGEREGDELRG